MKAIVRVMFIGLAVLCTALMSCSMPDDYYVDLTNEVSIGSAYLTYKNNDNGTYIYLTNTTDEIMIKVEWHYVINDKTASRTIIDAIVPEEKQQILHFSAGNNIIYADIDSVTFY